MAFSAGLHSDGFCCICLVVQPANSCVHRPQQARLKTSCGTRWQRTGQPEGVQPTAQDVPGGVHVGVRRVAAVPAAKPGSLAGKWVNASAVSASLGCAGRIHPDKRNTGTRGLVFQLGEHHPPSLFQYAPVQPGLGGDVPARRFRCSRCRGRHIPDVQPKSPQFGTLRPAPIGSGQL